MLLFWIVAAELYSKEDVGTAAYVLSSLFLIELISRLGLDYSIIRFFPERNKCDIFNTSIILAPLLTLLLSIIYIDRLCFSDLGQAGPFNIEIKVIYILIPFMLSALVILGTSFKAIHKAELSLFQNSVGGLSILLLLPFLSLGTAGIAGAHFVSLFVVLLILMPLANRLGFRFFLRLDIDFVRETFRFSAGNYLSNLFSSAIYLILPIMVMSVLGAIETAHFSLAFKICSFLFIVPATIGEALFIEGSNDKDLKRLVLVTIKVVTISLLILSILLYSFSYQILQFVGRDAFNENYLDSLNLLRMLIFSSFFVAFTSIYLAIKKIKKDINKLVIASGLITFSITISCYVFMKYFGFMGLGYGWVAGYGLSSIIIGILAFREFQSGNKYP